MVQDKIMAIKVDEDTRNKIEDFAKKTYRSKSGVIKYAINNIIEGDQDGGS